MKTVMKRIKYLAVFALTFSTTLMLASGVLKASLSTDFGEGDHSRVNRVISLQKKVYTMENRIRDLESGDYARRIAFITNSSPESALALDAKLSGRINESRTELGLAKQELAALTGSE